LRIVTPFKVRVFLKYLRVRNSYLLCSALSKVWQIAFDCSKRKVSRMEFRFYRFDVIIVSFSANISCYLSIDSSRYLSLFHCSIYIINFCSKSVSCSKLYAFHRVFPSFLSCFLKSTFSSFLFPS